MNKKSEEKERQGYTKILKTCANCDYMTKEVEILRGYFHKIEVDKKLRCSIGNFAVQKMATCNKHELRILP